MKTGKPILVVYYSLTGRTSRVAQDIAARLGADLERVIEKKNRRGLLGYLGAALDSIRQSPTQIADTKNLPNDYALTVVGTPVWAGRMTPAARAYLRGIHGALNEAAFFITSGSTDAAKVVPAMEELADRKAIASTGFNARELGSTTLYEQKISAFVAAIEKARADKLDAANESSSKPYEDPKAPATRASA
jgi:flavodoxin